VRNRRSATWARALTSTVPTKASNLPPIVISKSVALFARENFPVLSLIQEITNDVPLFPNMILGLPRGCAKLTCFYSIIIVLMLNGNLERRGSIENRNAMWKTHNRKASNEKASVNFLTSAARESPVGMYPRFATSTSFLSELMPLILK